MALQDTSDVGTGGGGLCGAGAGPGGGDGPGPGGGGGPVPETPATTKIYDVSWALEGLMPDDTVFPWTTFVRDVDFEGSFSGSAGSVEDDPTATATFTVNKDGAAIGTIVVATDGTVTFTTTAGSAVSFTSGDRLTITTPTIADATLTGPAFTLKGTRT